MGWLLDDEFIVDLLHKVWHYDRKLNAYGVGDINKMHRALIKAQASKIFERLDKYDKGCPIKDMGRVFDIPLKEWQQFKEEVMG